MHTLTLTNATLLTAGALDASLVNANNGDIENFYRPTSSAGGLGSGNFITNTGVLPEQFAEPLLRGCWSGWQDTLTFRRATTTPSDSQNRESLFACLAAYSAPTNLTIIDVNFYLTEPAAVPTADPLIDPLQLGLLIGMRPDIDERAKEDDTNADEVNPNAYRLLPSLSVIGNLSLFTARSHDGTLSIAVASDVFVPQGALVIPVVQLAARAASTISADTSFRVCWSINYAGRPV